MADLCNQCGHPLPNSVPCYYCTHCGEPTPAGRSASAKLPARKSASAKLPARKPDQRTHRRVSDWQDKLKDDRRLT